MYKITFKKKAAKELRKVPSVFLNNIVVAIDGLAENPRPDNSKKLKASKENIWRIRIGNYRVLYLIDDGVKIVNIRKVAQRKDAYKP